MEGNYKKWLNRINAKLDKGTYTGTASDLVPYTGANKDVNIGAFYFESSAGFKKTGGTSTQALTADGGTFDLNTKADLVNGKVPQLQSQGSDLSLDYTTNILKLTDASGDEKNVYLNKYEEVLIKTDSPTFDPSTDPLVGKFWFNITNGKVYSREGLVWQGQYQLITTSEKTNYDTAYTHSQINGNPHNTTKLDIGLSNVDNTSDLNKPISTATQSALNSKQNKLETVSGNTGVGKTDASATEKLDVNGNVKAIDFKGQSIKFNLQTSITPTPNTLVPKTDGSGLIWYNNSSVGAEIPSYSSPTSGYVARWDGAKFVNGSVQDDGINIGVGTTSDTNTLPARVKINPNNQKYFNLPLSSLSTTKPTTINVGDFYTAHNRLWFKVNDNNFAPATNYDTEIKVLGFQYDFRGDDQFRATQNFNDLHSNNPRFGKSAIVNTGLYYGRTIIVDAPSSVGVDSRMYEGWLYSIDRSFVSGVQYFIDAKGQFFVRSLGGNYHSSTTWGKAVLEKQNTTTQLEEKLALARVKLKSYTKSERDALTNKEVGEMIWQTDSGNSGIRVFNGTNWLALQTTID